MELDVYNFNKSAIRLKLQKFGNEICLMVVDENGNRREDGALLNISQDGVSLCKGVSEYFGFNLDEDDRLKIIS